MTENIVTSMYAYVYTYVPRNLYIVYLLETYPGFFLTKIFHPNVAKNGAICVNTLKRDWKPDNGLKHILLVSLEAAQLDSGLFSYLVQGLGTMVCVQRHIATSTGPTTVSSRVMKWLLPRSGAWERWYVYNVILLLPLGPLQCLVLTTKSYEMVINETLPWYSTILERLAS